MENSNNPDRAYVFRNGIEVVNNIHVKYAKPFHVIRKRAACKSFTNLFWHIFSGFTFYKYAIIDDETKREIACTHISKNLPHFDFIHRLGGGYHIGPDFTVPEFRGLGFHPYILSCVLKDTIKKDPNEFIYIIVSDWNIASIKGIEKSGFNFVCSTKHEEFQYKLVEGSETIPVINKPRAIWSRVFNLLSKIKR